MMDDGDQAKCRTGSSAFCASFTNPEPRSPSEEWRKPLREDPPQKSDPCNKYSVTNTRVCLFNHTRPPAFSKTYNPPSATGWRTYFLHGHFTYVYVRT